jgi:putative beta-lysine N-acetyltransferase
VKALALGVTERKPRICPLLPLAAASAFRFCVPTGDRMHLMKPPTPEDPVKESAPDADRHLSTTSGEWAPLEPSEKRMGLVRLTLDRGVRTTVIGQVYGLDFEIEGDGYTCRVFFDYYNRRLKVIDYDATDHRAMLDRLAWVADENAFDKIFFKARKDDWQILLRFGYMLEGILRYYYRGEDAYVLSRFRTLERVTSTQLIEESRLIESLLRTDEDYAPPPLPDGYRLFPARPEHIPAMVALYREVFATYPSPLTHPDYVLATMERDVIYACISDENGDIVSAASAEIDVKHSNAELTDCATLKKERGRSLMFHILTRLEGELVRRQIMTGYSLARAPSVGMNRVFRRLGYAYSGRLINNCDIYGQFEDMNIWVRRLSTTAAAVSPIALADDATAGGPRV